MFQAFLMNDNSHANRESAWELFLDRLHQFL